MTARKVKAKTSVRKRGPARIAQVQASKVRKDASIIGAITKGRGFSDTPATPAFLELDECNRRLYADPSEPWPAQHSDVGEVTYVDRFDPYAAVGGSGILYPKGFKHAEPKGTHRRTGFLLCVLTAVTVLAFYVWLGA